VSTGIRGQSLTAHLGVSSRLVVVLHRITDRRQAPRPARSRRMPQGASADRFPQAGGLWLRHGCHTQAPSAPLPPFDIPFPLVPKPEPRTRSSRLAEVLSARRLRRRHAQVLPPDRGAPSGAPCTGLLRPAADATAWLPHVGSSPAMTRGEQAVPEPAQRRPGRRRVPPSRPSAKAVQAGWRPAQAEEPAARTPPLSMGSDLD